MIGQVGNALGAWGKPVDPVAWAALALAVLLAAAAFERHHLGLSLWFHGASRRRFIVVSGFVAAFLSLGYIAFYLRGGPRIIDATSYFMQGRALSHGKFSWPLLGPTASYRGRFFLFEEPNRLAGIFPPGYPLLLSLGFLIGAPMVIGPLLAAGIAAATYLLTREIGRTFPAEANIDLEATARFAAIVSIFCAALRYHTADTMSHGACALAFALTLGCALYAVRRGKTWMLALCGLGVGYVAATRMVSAIPLGIGVVLLTWPRASVRGLLLFVLGIVPGLALLALSQWAATGDPLQSTQIAYYATSDGPAGCFRYGFGRGVGCLVEHADFVRARLPHGYGVLEAAGVTARRLWLHAGDVVNFEPLFLLLLFPVVRAARASRAYRAMTAVVILQVLAYAPFYFDGNYPGGGARFFADILPLEHAVVALSLAVFFARNFERAAFALLSLASIGFAVHGAYGHHALAERDGGHPMYLPDVVRQAGFTDGLLFFDTDHGFDLAYDPSLTSSHGIAAVRRRNDDGDRLLYDLLGHPISHLYRFVPEGQGTSSADPWTPLPITGDTYRFEAEVEWPPIAQGGGYAQPLFASDAGASQDRVLQLTPEDNNGEAWAEIELPMPHRPMPDRNAWMRVDIQPRVVLRGTGARGILSLYKAPQGPHPDAEERLRWEWSDDLDPSGKTKKTQDLSAQSLALEEGGAPMSYRLVLRAQHGPVGLDKTTVKAHR